MQYTKAIILFSGLFLLNNSLYGTVYTDFINQGITYMNELDTERAIYSFSKAIEYDQNNVEAYIQRAKAYLLNNEFEKSSADYEKAMQIDPEYVRRRLNIRIYTEQMKY
jgi:tetratricopeptide (TPR) repeat protein